MHWNTTYELVEQHRNDLLQTAAEARLARIARKGSLLQNLVARFAKTTPQPQPVVVADVDTLPVHTCVV